MGVHPEWLSDARTLETFGVHRSRAPSLPLSCAGRSGCLLDACSFASLWKGICATGRVPSTMIS